MAPNQYAIGVTKNKFALFDSEEELDPHELLKKQEKEKEEKKKTKVAEKTNPVKPARNNKVSNTNMVKVVNNFKQPAHTLMQKDQVKPRQSYPPGPRKQVNFNEHNQSGHKQSFEEPPNYVYVDRNAEKFEHLDSRGDGSSGSESGAPERNGRGGNRFSRVFVRGGGGRGRGGNGGDDRRKREYDRHSGSDKTGVKAVDKRRAGGSYNWGNPQDDIYNDQLPQEPITPDEPPADQIGSESAEPGKDEGEQMQATEEEKPALTLDEWRAQKSYRQKPAYNLRQAGEGEDMTRWKKMYALTKKAAEEEGDEEEEYDLGEFPQRVGRQKKLEIDVRFYDRQRGRGRGRGGGRGSPGRTPGGQAPPAPRVDDEALFPSLGPK